MRLLILILIVSIASFAKTSKKDKPYILPDMLVNKNEFIKFLRDESPKDFCNEKSYFIKCFDVVESQCPDDVKASFDVCKKSVKIPDKFDVLEIDLYSSKLGECVGTDIERQWIERKKGSRECRQRF